MTTNSILENVVSLLMASAALGFVIFAALGFVATRLIALVCTAVDLLREVEG